jgi:hypothetical protein
MILDRRLSRTEETVYLGSVSVPVSRKTHENAEENAENARKRRELK